MYRAVNCLSHHIETRRWSPTRVAHDNPLRRYSARYGSIRARIASLMRLRTFSQARERTDAPPSGDSWAHSSTEPVSVTRCPGPHTVLIELADVNYKVLAPEGVKLDVPQR